MQPLGLNCPLHARIYFYFSLGHRMHRREHGLALDDGGHGALGHRSLMADHFRKSTRSLDSSLY